MFVRPWTFLPSCQRWDLCQLLSELLGCSSSGTYHPLLTRRMNLPAFFNTQLGQFTPCLLISMVFSTPSGIIGMSWVVQGGITEGLIVFLRFIFLFLTHFLQSRLGLLFQGMYNPQTSWPLFFMSSYIHANCDLEWRILYSHYRNPYIQFSGAEKATIRYSLSFDYECWLDYRNVSG